MADFDLNEAISSLLSDPETGEKISSLMASLTSPEKAKDSDDEEKDEKVSSFPDIGKLLEVKRLYDSAMEEKDPNIVLLASLKPYLSENRCKSLDSMMKMLKIYKVFLKVKDTPLLKELF